MTAINGKRSAAANNNMALLQERWNDPLLTGLTALLVVMLFVIARFKPWEYLSQAELFLRLFWLPASL